MNTHDASDAESRVAADLLIEQGNAREDAGSPEAAQELYAAAAARAPWYARAWVNLGIVTAAQSRFAEAVKSFDRALAADPGSAPAYYNRALALTRMSLLDEAEISCRDALRYRPQFPDALAALADLLERRGCLVDAAAALRLASEQAPGHAGYLTNYGLLQRKRDDLDSAEVALASALALDPSSTRIAMALADTARDKGNTRKACEILASALDRDPECTDAESDLLFTLLFRDDLPAQAVAERHFRFGEAVEARAVSGRLRQAPTRGIARRRLRIGYVSGDFRRHAVANFALPVLEGHDRGEFETYCYSNSAQSDDVTAAFRRAAEHWREIDALADAKVADMVREDGVDLLVDLSGHSGNPRLGLFVLRPAAVQATWLGYLATTGLKSIDFRISDGYADPEGMTERYHTEQLARLPLCQWCYRPYLSPPCLPEPPLVERKACTFGSFNQFGKLSPTTRSLWARVLLAVPDSTLMVAGAPTGEATHRLVQDFVDLGVAAHRLDVRPRADLLTYFKLLGEVDVALDPTPYSGATTTCDALWMGVPVVTLAGLRSQSRSGVSILNAAGLPELIADSPGAFVDTAREIARDTGRLQRWRRTLRAKIQASPLMNESRFVQDLQELYRKLVERRR